MSRSRIIVLLRQHFHHLLPGARYGDHIQPRGLRQAEKEEATAAAGVHGCSPATGERARMLPGERPLVDMKLTSWLSSFSALALFLSLAAVAYAQPGVMVPGEVVYRVNCGATTWQADAEGRNWTTAENFLISKDAVPASTFSRINISVGDPMVLSTALFSAPGGGALAFSFSMAPARTFLRLHFATIAQATTAQDVFHVDAAGVQLLVNFSVATAAGGVNMEVFREYVLPQWEGDALRVNFVPSAGSSAFVNAIEVFSRPDANTTYIGENMNAKFDNLNVNASHALQTMYRINVGGPAIEPEGPSQRYGDLLGRYWESDLQPNPALEKRYVGYATPYPTAKIRNSDVAPDFIPLQLSRFDRSMDKSYYPYNLTYRFKVDPGWSYLVRYHFSENVYAAFSMRVMNLYINSDLVRAHVDIFSLYGALTACYMDFIVPLEGNMTTIRASVETSALSLKSFGMSVTGMEVLKIGTIAYGSGGTTMNLAAIPPGLNPLGLLLPPPPGPQAGSPLPPQKRRSSHQSAAAVIVAVALGSVLASLFAVAVVTFCYRRKQRAKGKGVAVGEAEYRKSGNLGSFARSPSAASLPKSYMRAPTSPEPQSGSLTSESTLPQQSTGLGRRFQLEEINLMTDSFNEDRVLGMGGFGKVYKGELEDKSLVAVKRGSRLSAQGVHEFRTEIELLSRLRHRHLVSLIGYCEDEGEMILVYDYMGQGPLRNHLYGQYAGVLTWRSRLEICIGAARGLHYLHTGDEHGIIHRDVKSTNILLDDQFVAKVADFGLSKSGPNMDQTHVSTAVKGSFGYLDPEYYRRQQLTEKSDVYSFGVVLLEVICARPVISPHLPRDQINIVEWALSYQRRGALKEIVDTNMQGMWASESLNKVGELAEKCLAEEGANRPSMNDVLWNLEAALALQDCSTSVVIDNPRPAVSRQTSRATDAASDYSSYAFSESSDAYTAELGGHDHTVFSQLAFPEGR